jgi:pyruvate formate lyase activating enzyme
MGSAVVGRIFDLKRFSVHDGPGIRTTVFLQGCPLSCAWCHNPESRPAESFAVFRRERCLACGICGDSCPQARALTPDDPFPAGCVRCGSCAAVCPGEAREIVGRVVTADEVLAQLDDDRLFFDESGGGATFSGGEPLAQPDFLAACLTGCRAREIRTAVDTSGHAAPEVIAALLPLVDLWLYDLKHPDPARHAALTGVGNELILANLGRLARARATVWVRIPVIPDFNDAPAEIEAAGRLVADLPGVRRVHLLPYHAAAAAKRARFGLADAPVVPAAPPDHLEDLAGRLAALGLDVHLGG